MKRLFVIASLVILLLCLTTACGRKGPDAPPDKTPPMIIATNPVLGSVDVPSNTAISVTFSEMVDAETVSFLLMSTGTDTVPCTMSYSDKTAVFTPSGDLAYSKQFIATMKAGVTDQAGNVMPSDYPWSFTTGTAPDTTPPSILPDTLAPARDAVNVPIYPTISVTFSEPMNPSTVNTTTLKLSGNGLDIPGTVTLDDTGMKAIFMLSGPLAYNTPYTVTIVAGASGVKDMAGNALAPPDYTWSFTTAPQPPYTITASAGANGTISPAGSVGLNSGANQQFTITPNTGYHVANVLVDGISVGAVTTYTFTNVTAGHTISASFAINTTSTSVISSPNPSTFGVLVTFTATVTSAFGTPTGTVIFSDGGTSIGTGTLSAGVATLGISTLSGGPHSITAVYNGDTNFAASTSSAVTQTVNKAGQTISFGTAPSLTYGGGNGTVTATATSGLPVTFSSLTTGVCTISGSTVTPVAAGTCSIAANQAGNSNYTAAPQVTQNITVAAAGQTIGTISFTPSTLAVNGTTTASATATSGLSVTFSSLTTGVCTVSGTNGATVTGVAAGTCTIAANQAGNANYSAAPQVTRNITVGAAAQTIGTISFSPSSLAVNGTTTASATSTSGLPVTFSSLTTGVCTVSGTNGTTVTGVSAGTCTIAANQAGNANYSAAPQVTQNITVAAAGQTIGTISFTPSTLAVNGTTTASATATSGLPVTFSSLTTGVCTVSGTNGATVTGVSAGTCTIAANQAGNANYNAAPQVTQNITVAASGQTISTISFTPSTLAVNGTTTASATATSGLPVTFSSLTTGICTVSGSHGSSVTAVAAGTCTIAANQAGNANYTAAPQVTQNITVN